jgi:nucleotide-binding universal stress UspA family protein
MRVLAAVDGSPGSFDAVSQVAQLLTPGKDEVSLYCSPPEVRLQSGAASGELLVRARKALADAIFDEARKRLGAGLQNEAHMLLGTQDPRQGIVVAAEQWAAHLIVVGARGLGTLERLLLGSVSRAVVHAAKIPVWVARSKSATVAKGLRILLACENAEMGQQTVELLGRFAWPAGTTCHTLTAISSIFAGRVPDWLQQQARSPDVEAMVQNWVREHDALLRGNLASMEQLVKSLPPTIQAARPLTVEGEPATEILAAVAREHVDLVVLGKRRHGPIASFVVGSTSEAVLNHAGCSVLVLPHREEP